MTENTANETLLRNAALRLVAWYRENKKDYPWRQEPTPYHVWISEIMLQQTRIEAALDYYTRFIKELPDVFALAAVEDDRLMKLWQGLGYYSRARNLKKAALTLVNEHGGVLPDDAGALQKLPGIGEYTAGAIASIAYHKPEPAVDGNVLRVLSRLLLSYDDIMLPATKKAMTAKLRSVYPCGEEASLLTEGLMELGEVVCIPNGEPRCAICPVADLCRAKEQGEQNTLPVRIVRKEKRKEDKTVLLLRSKQGRYALLKRPEKGLLCGLWSFPTLDGLYAEGDVESYLISQGIQMSSLSDIGNAEHIFTHIIWQMQGYLALVDCEADSFEWKSREEILSEYAIPSAYRYYIKQLQ